MTVTATAHLGEDYQNNPLLTVWITIAIATAILIVLVAIIIGIALALYFRRGSQKTEYDSLYSVLQREATQQLQSQSVHLANDLYDHIQLSPSTGQAEFISKTETDNKNNPSTHHHQHSIYHSVDTEQPNSAAMQITDRSSKNIPSHENKITIEHPTYAFVNKTEKERKKDKEPVHCPPKTSPATSLSLTKQNSTHNIHSQPVKNAAKVDQPIILLCNQEIKQNIITKQIPSQTSESPEELYTAVRKNTKESTAQNEEEPPPIPSQGVEQLYTTVNKRTQPTTANDEVESPQIPIHTVEELYTAVMKKPKARETDDEVEAPPVPPHTVEELYTAVQKNKN